MNTPLKKYFPTALLVILFGFHIFFHFYKLQDRLTFANDQVDNAWAAVRILIEHRYPLQGMMAKANSGISIGPAYYYLVALFYALTHFDPIASALLAGVTSIMSFFVLFLVTKKLFNSSVALWALFIYVFAINIIVVDRVQWPVNFIPPLSLLVFYFLYKVLMGEIKYLIHVAVTVGLFFHVHFSAIFYPIIIVATLPFFPWSSEAFKYMFISLPIFIVFFIPHMLYQLQSKSYSLFDTASRYQGTYSHGFHLRRFWQLFHYPYFEIEKVLPYPILRNILFTLFPIFSSVLCHIHNKRKWFVITYLIALWILIPWLIFTLYSGEISDYYFSSFRFIAIVMLAYLSWRIWNIKNIIIKILPLLLWGYIAVTNIAIFFLPFHTDYNENIRKVQKAVANHEIIQFIEGAPESYFYYWMTKIQNVNQ